MRRGGVILGKNPVLIVEDEEGIQTLLKLSLEMHDHEVVGARNGREALELLKTIPRPCLILLDLMMPVMNGRDFAATLDADPELRTIPIAMMSAFSDRAASIKNVVAVIEKPIDLSNLLEVVRKNCG